MEIPNVQQPINFLDLSIKTIHHKIDYWWYRKEMHSGILLSTDSYLPQHTKTNFICNTFNIIEKRCSTEEMKRHKEMEFEKLLAMNGYKDSYIQKCKNRTKLKKLNRKASRPKKTFNTINTIPLFLDYISEETNRKIKKAINKYGLNISLISRPAPQLSRLLSRRQTNTTIYHNKDNCEICKSLNKNYKCTDRHVVYKITCR